VPIGGRIPRRMWDGLNLRRAACLLRRATLRAGDFEQTLRDCRKGDWVYLDPPYPKRTEEDLGFNRYARAPYTREDHRRLGRVASELDRSDVKVLLSLSARSSLLKYYPSHFARRHVRTDALISCDGPSRGRTTEVLLFNYVPSDT